MLDRKSHLTLIEVGRSHLTLVLMHNRDRTLLTHHRPTHALQYIGALTEECSHIKASMGRLGKYCKLCPRDKRFFLLYDYYKNI